MDFKEEFIWAYKNYITRPGAAELLKYIESTSFFSDPASTAYHLSREGGLCEHSLNVFRRLFKLAEWRNNEISSKKATHTDAANNLLTMDSVAVVSLLHDLCKAGTYKKETKNRKTYDREAVRKADPGTVRSDACGEYIWESVSGYSWDDPFPYGHGEKSVYLIQKYMQLTDEEALAIRYHMSTWQEKDSKSSIGKVFETNSLAFLLHIADEMATNFDEREKKD